MNDTRIDAQYSTGLSRRNIEQALIAAGKDLGHLQPADLGPLEDFHTLGRIATSQLAELAKITTEDAVLDAGSGIGGTARFLADQYRCRVTAIDLTEEYCETARWLNRLTGLDDRISVRQGDVTNLPFADASFQVVTSQHVQMNVADKARLYGEARRVLVPGGRLAIWDITAGQPGELDYPLPWADRPERSPHFRRPAACRRRVGGLHRRALGRSHRPGGRADGRCAVPACWPAGAARLRRRLRREGREPHPRSFQRAAASHPGHRASGRLRVPSGEAPLPRSRAMPTGNAPLAIVRSLSRYATGNCPRGAYFAGLGKRSWPRCWLERGIWARAACRRRLPGLPVVGY